MTFMWQAPRDDMSSLFKKESNKKRLRRLDKGLVVVESFEVVIVAVAKHVII